MLEDASTSDLKKIIEKPSFFVEEFIGVEPLDYQKNFLDCGKKRRHFVAGRQVGKSRSLSWFAIWYAVTHDNVNVLILAKAQRQSMELFNTLKKELRKSDAKEEWGIPRETRTEVEFENGSRILCLPTGTDGANIRGYSADLLMVDEAAFVPNTIFQEVLSPMLAVGDNTFVMASTPLGKKGYFYERYREALESQQRGEEPLYHVTHAKTEDNPYVSDKFIREQKDTLTPIQFKQEILGQFVEASDAYFTTDEVLADNVAVSEPVTQQDEKCYLGADIAHTGDDASVYITMDGKGNIFDIDYSHGRKLTDAIGRIRTLDNRFNYDKIVIDQTGLGAGVVDQLQESLGRKVEGFTFTSSKKSDLYSTLKDAFQNEELRFRFERNQDENENKMVQQLTALEYSYTSTGRMRIAHPSGGHDDFCDALALANWARQNRAFTPSDRESMKPFNMGDLRPKSGGSTGSGQVDRRNSNRRYRR